MILLPAQIESITTRKDKTVKITIGTQELTPADAAKIFYLNQQFCYMALKPEPHKMLNSLAKSLSFPTRVN